MFWHVDPNLQWYKQDVPLIAPYVIDGDNARDGGEQRGQHSNLSGQHRQRWCQILLSVDAACVWHKYNLYDSLHLVNPVEVQLLAQGYMKKC